MNDKEKQIINKLKALKLNYPMIYKYMKRAVIVIIIVPILIWGAYFVGDCGFVLIRTSLAVGDALTFYGSILAFIGTVLLGALALWQNKKANEINERLLNLENSRENKIIFEMYFSYVEEFGNIFDPIYVLGKPNDVRNDLDIFNVIKSSQLKALSIKRRLLFIDKDNSSHIYLKYVMDKYNEILSIVIKTDSNSSKDIFKKVMSFIKSNADDNNKKSLEFMYYINKKLFMEDL
jgi:hypothetical protein